MTNYSITMRDREPDANNRKNTHRFVLRAKGRLDAMTRAMEDHPEWQVVDVSARDGSE